MREKVWFDTPKCPACILGDIWVKRLELGWIGWSPSSKNATSYQTHPDTGTEFFLRMRVTQPTALVHMCRWLWEHWFWPLPVSSFFSHLEAYFASSGFITSYLIRLNQPVLLILGVPSLGWRNRIRNNPRALGEGYRNFEQLHCTFAW